MKHSSARLLSLLLFCLPTFASGGLVGCSDDTSDAATGGDGATGGPAGSGGGSTGSGGAATGTGGGGSGATGACRIASPEDAIWSAPNGIDERSIVATAASDGTLWVGTRYGLFRSDDGGASFQSVALEGVGTAVLAEVYAVAASGDDVYIAIENVAPDPELRVSHDRGANWETMSDGIVMGIGFDPVSLLRTDGTTVLMRTFLGSGYRWDEATSSWVDLAPPPSFIDAFALDGSTIYVARSFEGLFWSDDGGGVWSSFPDDTTSFGTTALTVHDGFVFRTIQNGTCTTQRSANKGETWDTLPLDEATYGCTYDLLSTSGSLIASTSLGIARSDDDGASWSLVVSIGEGPEQLIVQSVALATDGAAVYAGRDQMLVSTDTIAWSPTSPVGAANAWSLAAAGDAMFATNGDFKTYRSIDGGETWSHVTLTASGQPWPGGFVSMAHDDPSADALFGIVADAFPWQPALAGTGVLFRSMDDGASWSSFGGAGLSSLGPIEQRGSVVLVGTHDRVGQNGEAPFLLPGGDGFLRSTNGGASWDQAIAGLPVVPT